MKVNFRILAKAGFLLVFIGFFMPISCNLNGFQIASVMTGISPLLMWLMFLAAVAGIVVGVLLLLNKEILPVIAEWIILGVCVGSGIILFLSTLGKGTNFQIGAFVILLGWIVAVAGHLIAKKNGEL